MSRHVNPGLGIEETLVDSLPKRRGERLPCRLFINQVESFRHARQRKELDVNLTIDVHALELIRPRVTPLFAVPFLAGIKGDRKLILPLEGVVESSAAHPCGESIEPGRGAAIPPPPHDITPPSFVSSLELTVVRTKAMKVPNTPGQNGILHTPHIFAVAVADEWFTVLGNPVAEQPDRTPASVCVLHQAHTQKRGGGVPEPCRHHAGLAAMKGWDGIPVPITLQTPARQADPGGS